jgi:iron complex outermembrane recepter protein
MQCMVCRHARNKKFRESHVTRLTIAGCAVALLACQIALAQSARTADDATQPETVVVTGSLIPQDKTATLPTPVVTITPEDLESKGFTSIADALQQASFSTGLTQEGDANSFTPGAHTISMFALDPSYTKYLIDGRPMANYPALYNGTDLTASINGIPSALIERIDVLPGGQSSIYGSDAIAGVINIVMKKDFDAPLMDVKYGWDQDGGGKDWRISLADGVTFGNLHLVGGGQYETLAPLWGYQRPLTRGFNVGGTSAGIAARDWLVFGYYGPAGDFTNTYYFQGPANCANVAGLFGNSVGVRTRANHGQYCGSFSTGDQTFEIGEDQAQGYFGATLDLGDHLQLYANVLLAYDKASFEYDAGVYSTTVYPSDPRYYFYDPILGDFMNLQHIFSPEEAGGLNKALSHDFTNSERFTMGGKGSLWMPALTYDVSFTYDKTRLAEHQHTLLTSAVSSYYDPVFGPLSTDPLYADFGPTYANTNYAAFYQPVTPASYAGFTGVAVNRSYTEDTLARAQLTDAELFDLPGGKAGLALVGETGTEGWDYVPDPLYAAGQVYGIQTDSGTGHRSRYAGTMELRLPILSMLNVTASGRYDGYNVTGGNFSKFTYTFGAEFKPVSMLAVRGRYGTAFKAPTLADEFQGPSGFYATVTDYYQCSIAGFSGANLDSCPSIYLQDSVQASTSGNPALKPITADVWDVGIEVTPLPMLSITSDLMSWNINNEVAQQSLDTLLKDNSACLLGTLDPTSPTCVQALAAVQRNAQGVITVVSDPKVNLSNERITTVVTALKYVLPTGSAGTFTLDMSWTDMIKHTFAQFPGDTPIDLLGDPFSSVEFKSKLNASLTWDIAKFGTTVYVNREGHTPNYLASLQTTGFATPGAHLLAAYTPVNWSAHYEVWRGLTVTATVDNVFNAMPPPDSSYPNYQDGPFDQGRYNIIGRTFAVEANYQFMK